MCMKPQCHRADSGLGTRGFSQEPQAFLCRQGLRSLRPSPAPSYHLYLRGREAETEAPQAGPIALLLEVLVQFLDPVGHKELKIVFPGQSVLWPPLGGLKSFEKRL